MYKIDVMFVFTESVINYTNTRKYVYKVACTMCVPLGDCLEIQLSRDKTFEVHYSLDCEK